MTDAKANKKEYNREYWQRPDVKAKASVRVRIRYWSDIETSRRKHREYIREYRKRPYVLQKEREYMKEYGQRPEVIARRKEKRARRKKNKQPYLSNSEHKALPRWKRLEIIQQKYSSDDSA